ncbi:hypothetical protein K9L67_05120 [Candidatus Woesearchaeota archaeon]|nr:hypothetical protein [Candidatus Woesearchaeota archaeon]MCF7901579.1 hypothetical protein [Candidatus Woesearchaeota archaeon]MCF8013983.1 hypothetical protein [Candidatus Woesearchaeota archaeon]
MSIEIVTSEEALSAVQNRGPLLPMDVRKYLGKGDSITIGAALSTLFQSKKVLTTNVKKGGSPFYYVVGQEAKLDLVSGNLNEKDKQTYDFLKENKVVRDSKQDPLTRVSLRQIKDFSRSFEVVVNGEKETFWRYYLISEKEAYIVLNERYAPKKEEVEIPKEHESKVQEVKKEMIQDDQKSNEEKSKSVKQEQQVTKQDKQETQKKVKTSEQRNFTQKKSEEQKTLQEEDQENIFETVEDDFLDTIKKFFDNNLIKVKEAELIRKGSEYNFVITMSTPMGKAEYFCKAKSKKKSNDGDLSSAYIQGQTRRIPTVYLTTGEVTKKAKEKINKEYKGMLIKEI